MTKLPPSQYVIDRLIDLVIECRDKCSKGFNSRAPCREFKGSFTNRKEEETEGKEAEVDGRTFREVSVLWDS
jgi:hypothetical protein